MQQPLGMDILKRLRTGARFRLFVLAALLVFSQVALACHQAAHFVPDRAQCELCVCQAQPLCAPLPTVSTVPVLAEQYFSPQAEIPAFTSTASRSAYHSRAPPLQA